MTDIVKLPQWVADGSVTLRYAELRPDTIAEIVSCLAAQDPLDARVFELRNLYRSLTGEPLA